MKKTNKTAIQIVSIVLIAILLTNFIMFVLGKIKMATFWIIIVIGAICAYVLQHTRRKL